VPSNMRVRELFKSGSLTQLIKGTTNSLDRENCQIVSKTRSENSIILNLRRESDGNNARARLKVRDKFETISNQLLNWAFNDDKITGLTLNQLDDLETNLSIEKVRGRVRLVAEESSLLWNVRR